VQDLGENLQRIDHARPRTAEVRVAVDDVHLVVSHGREVPHFRFVLETIPVHESALRILA
jgi:hypothetical protein